MLEKNNALWKPGKSPFTYDVNGHLNKATDVGSDSNAKVDYIQQMQTESAEDGKTRDELYRAWRLIASADFDQNYQPINSSYPTGAGQGYTVNTGDTLQHLADDVKDLSGSGSTLCQGFP